MLKFTRKIAEIHHKLTKRLQETYQKLTRNLLKFPRNLPETYLTLIIMGPESYLKITKKKRKITHTNLRMFPEIDNNVARKLSECYQKDSKNYKEVNRK